ncbi:MAG: cobalamin-binding domain-containing protein [Verrucomicrobia bacterium]|nr:MAG: cobalamin-binding domain-containing protein [Verrucomicrobiota bacterium]
MRIATYHRKRGDYVAFVRGENEWARTRRWDRIYVSSLFTWELPRTADTVNCYNKSVSEAKDIFVGGVAVTLFPSYIKERCQCTVIEGPLDMPGRLGPGSPAIAKLVPDYSILGRVKRKHEYFPRNAYFVRITKGCIRTCSFCAVPRLEKEFGIMSPLREQITKAIAEHGEKQHLVVMDNNILGIEGVEDIFEEIQDLGFKSGARRKGRERTVDFNQGLDARLISSKPALAKMLASVCVSPIRLAFDFIQIRPAYERAIRLLAAEGFHEFTNYMLFNFNDTPRDLYDRLWANANLNKELGIRITGFPMRFIPMDDVNRRHVGAGWKWRYLRGIQCILLATRGLVSPNPEFISGAFGETFEKFLEILSMPDRYIIYRSHYANDGAADWQKEFNRLDSDQKMKLLDTLQELNSFWRERPERLARLPKEFRSIMEHYYPGGNTAPKTPEEEELAQQGVSVGYDSGPG